MFLAFGAGLLSFLSPCVLPMAPVYLASMAGPGIFNSDARTKGMPLLLHTICFVLGFSTIFTLLGAGAGLLGLAIGAYIGVLRQLSGFLLILMGLFLLLSLKIPSLNFEKQLNSGRLLRGGHLRSFLIGAVFSLGWTPCVGPILGGVLTLAMGSETALRGAYLLAIYSLGLGLPFLIIGAFFDALRPWLKKLSRYANLIHILSALLLIGVGILVLTGNLALLSI
ncbi:MAG: cytochrome c biogenesis protein CcdA [Chloroflexota bacterium]